MKTCPPTSFRSQRIAVVGDFPSEEDTRSGVPFTSKAGQELTRMLKEAGINRADCWFSYVIPFAPKVGHQDARDSKDFCVPKKEYVELCSASGDAQLPALSVGKYVPPALATWANDLRRDLRELRPNVTICLGSLALWALTGSGALASVRGTAIDSDVGKLLPTYSPERVLQQWSTRVIVLVDLQKAKRESEFPEIRRPEREIWIDPSIEDLHLFTEVHLAGAKEIAVDIETRGGQITCVGFSPHPSVAIVVPFVDPRQPDLSYWRTDAEEVLAWKWVRTLLQSRLSKVTQNGLYDYQWLFKEGKMKIAGPFEDTMIMHHTMQPELEKGLGFLGSVYTNEASWKLMRKRSGDEGEKKDE